MGPYSKIFLFQTVYLYLYAFPEARYQCTNYISELRPSERLNCQNYMNYVCQIHYGKPENECCRDALTAIHFGSLL